MQKKILVSLALVAGLGITGFTSTANAGNISDSEYKYNFTTSGNTAYTNARSKYDSTSSYMRLCEMENGPGSFKVKVVKANTSDFSRYWWSDSFTNVGQQQYISNYAYEDVGYGVPVRMKAEGHGGSTTCICKVKWSPDSI